MNIRPKIIGLAFAAGLSLGSAEAQQPGKVPRIGLVPMVGNPTAPTRLVEAFRQGLRDLGYDEGKTL